MTKKKMRGLIYFEKLHLSDFFIPFFFLAFGGPFGPQCIPFWPANTRHARRREVPGGRFAYAGRFVQPCLFIVRSTVFVEHQNKKDFGEANVLTLFFPPSSVYARM